MSIVTEKQFWIVKTATDLREHPTESISLIVILLMLATSGKQDRLSLGINLIDARCCNPIQANLFNRSTPPKKLRLTYKYKRLMLRKEYTCYAV